jgi:hypothetical protein
MKINYNILVFSFFLILVTSGINAQRLVIRMNNGNENSEFLNTVQKLYFSDNELIVDFYSGSDDAYELSDIRKLYFDAAVSIDDITLQDINELTVYPNPAGNVITVLGIPAGAGSISVYRMDGRAVITRAVSSNHETINISTLQNGLYLLNAIGYTAKFVKK